MRYAGLNLNDFSAAPGVSVSFFTQGCPHRCKGCHNPETWEYNGGKEFTPDILDKIVEALSANGIERNLAIMGGEPLCEEN
jgi:anaerobic ribonucleoside-triphosphate reductase activating protein